ncbi:hypothetical protein [Bilophila wadsworthia]|uniref:hypothetical protein n=1 Tax=Bilophila wadsworthia TaxID=35833 RepID=UPI003AAD57BF
MLPPLDSAANAEEKRENTVTALAASVPARAYCKNPRLERSETFFSPGAFRFSSCGRVKVSIRLMTKLLLNDSASK